MKNSRIWMIGVLMIAGLCLFRVLSVAAATRDNDDVEERYAAMERGGDDSEDAAQAPDADGDETQAQDEIRITRPDEAASRVADEGDGYDLVPGAERFAGANRAGKGGEASDDDKIVVPKKAGRKIASTQEATSADSTPTSPIEVRPDVAVEPTRGELKSDVMEPKPFNQRELGSERAPLIEPPVPVSSSMARAGVQEISLIASDYGYFPKKIFVTQNVPVKLYLTTSSKATLCLMLDNFGLRKGISPGQVEEVVFMPNAPGDYRFYCPVKSIEGTITVREAPVARAVASQNEAKEEEARSPVDANTPKRAAKLRQLIED